MITNREERKNFVSSFIDNGVHIIALDGPCASGKTTLANDILSLMDVSIISMDHFFLPFELRTNERMNEKGGNIHYERFINEVVLPLKEGRDIEYRVFSCQSGSFSDTIRIPYSNKIIVEGSYSLHPMFGKYWDVAFFLSVSEKEQEERLIRRSPEKYDTFKNLWIPLENDYFSYYKIKERASYIL